MSFKRSIVFLIESRNHTSKFFAQESCSNDLLVSDEVRKSTVQH